MNSPPELPEDFLRVCNGLLDRIVAKSEVRSASLWKATGNEEYVRVGCRPRRGARPERFRLDAQSALWLQHEQGLAWRVTEHSILGVDSARVEGAVYLAISTGSLLLELSHAGDVQEHEAEEISSLLASISSVRGDHMGAGTATPVLSGPKEFELIDLTFVESIAMGDREFVVEILAMSLAGFRDGWRDILAALESGDRTSAGEHAHRLRSTARTVGATLLDERLLVLEMAPDVASASATTAGLRPLIDRMRAELSRSLERFG